MKGNKLGNRPYVLRALVLTAMLTGSLFLGMQSLPKPSAAATPVFDRPNTQVDQGPGWTNSTALGTPDIACDVSGVLHVVWSDDRIGEAGIYHARSVDGGASWLGEQRIDGMAGMNNYAPSIAIDTTSPSYIGNIYVAWQVGSGITANISVMTSEDGGSTWINRTQLNRLGGSKGANSPQVVVETDGVVHVAFVDSAVGNENIYVASSVNGSATWEPEIQVSFSVYPDKNPSVAAGGSYAFVAWETLTPAESTIYIVYSFNSGVNWFQRTIVSTTLDRGTVSSISLMMDSSNILHAAWIRTDKYGYHHVVYCYSTTYSSYWGLRTYVDDAYDSLTYMPSNLNVLSYSGMSFVIWSDSRNGDRDVYVSWSLDGGKTWGDGEKNNNDARVDDTDENANGTDDSSDQFSPTATASPYGIYAVWSDSRALTSYHVFFAGFRASNLLITEVRDSPDGAEQIEIFNCGALPFNPTGWTLDVDGVQYPLDAIGLMPAASYRTIGDPITASVQIDITLGDEGGYIRLLNSTGALKDWVYYGQSGPAPDPLYNESTERVRVGTTYSDWWTKGSPSTFGFDNTALRPVLKPNVVLNEISFNPTNPNDAFIELYFKEGEPFDIGGSLLVGDSVYVLPSVVLANTSPYYVVQAAAAPALFSAMASSGDNIYLFNSSGALMDMAGWSSPHALDTSMSRIPDGNGTAEGFDDSTSITAGWRFDQTPSMPLVLVIPSQSQPGDPGNRVPYNLTVFNLGTSADYFNVEALLGPLGWTATLYQSDMVTLLPDSPGDPDSIPDTGLIAPAASADIHVKVDIPSSPPTVDIEKTAILATASANPLISSSAILTTVIYPYESPTGAADPTTIWVNTSGPAYTPKDTTLTMQVTGRGQAVVRPKPQDVVLMIDSSGSMTTNDPSNMRLAAAKYYVDLLSVPDMAAVIDFDTIATLVNNDHLSTNYANVKVNIDTIDSAGGTDIVTPLVLGTNELIGYGDSTHQWVEILLTDGQGGTISTILSEARRAANNSIRIFTIGLGTYMDEGLLQDIAEITGGAYLKAETAEQLKSVYYTISRLVYDTAGFDRDVYDDSPMVSVYLPDYISYVAGSANPAPSYIGPVGGKTNLQWNITELKIGEVWSASIRVMSSMVGTGVAAISTPDSAVSYVRYDNTTANMPFPEVLIDVLAPPPPQPDLTLTALDIVLTPFPPVLEATSVRVNATVWNLGANSSGTTFSRFHDGTPPSAQIGADQALPPMSVGESTTVSVMWTAGPAGTHEICVVADPDDSVAESNETNNIACLDVFVRPARPDYILVLNSPPTPLTLGLSKTVTFTITVNNQGNRSAVNDSTLAFYEELSPATPFSTFVTPPIATGGSSPPFNALWTSPATAGTYRVIAAADHDDNITEWEEGNNFFAWTINVVPGPITTLVVSAPRYISAVTYVRSSTPLDFSVTDRSGLGIVDTLYRVDNATWVNYSVTGSFNLAGEGDHYIEWYSVDMAGNVEPTASTVIRVDNTPPTTTISFGTPRYQSAQLFVRSDTNIMLTASDGGIAPVGVDIIAYCVDGGTWQTYASSFTLSGPDGLKTIEYRARDILTNAEADKSATVYLDNTAPLISVSPDANETAFDTLFNLSADDGFGSGVNIIEYDIDGGGWTTFTGTFTISAGAHTLLVRSTDNVGNTNTLSHPLTVKAQEANYKPFIALAFAIILAILGLWSAYERPWKEQETKKNMATAFSIIGLPFIIAELVTGIISYFTGELSIPPFVGLGMIVDLAIFVAGIAVAAGRVLRDPERKARKAQQTETPPPPPSE